MGPMGCYSIHMNNNTAEENYTSLLWSYHYNHDNALLSYEAQRQLGSLVNAAWLAFMASMGKDRTGRRLDA